MARLTDHDYLKNHDLLRANRAADNIAFVMLDPKRAVEPFQLLPTARSPWLPGITCALC